MVLIRDPWDVAMNPSRNSCTTTSPNTTPTAAPGGAQADDTTFAAEWASRDKSKGGGRRDGDKTSRSKGLRQATGGSRIGATHIRSTFYFVYINYSMI